jgi:hypothetical protein
MEGAQDTARSGCSEVLYNNLLQDIAVQLGVAGIE